ncbi:MAG: nodulation protein NfeD [Verrucomicrobiia bacterium]
MKRWGLIAVVLLFVASAFPARGENVCLIKVEGAIGPATASYISRAIDEASADGAQCLIIQLDTPGGLLDSTKVIVQKFLNSPVPTVVYVAPPGAQAGSAGCFITIAADVAAMAPATAIGAAHPVTVGVGEVDKTMKEKLENFYGSYIETIAAKRKRNADWAKSSVRESSAITAEKALDLNVIDFIAKDRDDLLKQLDGREVNSKKLKTAAATVTEISMSIREKVFQVVAHPQMMLVLTLIVMYGIIGELTSPGAILPGVAGVIALVVLLYLAAVLPMNAAGLALIAVAAALFIIDVFAPTHGVLTAGGVAAFFLGALMLFDRSDPFLRLSLSWIIPATVVTALFFIFVVGAGLRAQQLPVKTGKETLHGKTVKALTRIDAQGGKVFVEGEYWNAVSEVPIEQGQDAEITGAQGLTLQVKPKTS